MISFGVRSITKLDFFDLPDDVAFKDRYLTLTIGMWQINLVLRRFPSKWRLL